MDGYNYRTNRVCFRKQLKPKALGGIIINPRIKHIFVAILTSILLGACVSLSTFQSAQTVEKGDFAVKGGLVTLLTPDGLSGAIPEAGMRYGLTSNMDIGVKIDVGRVIFMDTKIELFQKPLTLSFDLGYSVIPHKNRDDKFTITSTGLYPMLIVGSKNWYFGAKKIYLIQYNGDSEESWLSNYDADSWLPTSLVVGRVFRATKGVAGTTAQPKKAKVFLEINTFVPKDSDGLRLIPGLGIEIAL